MRVYADEDVNQSIHLYLIRNTKLMERNEIQTNYRKGVSRNLLSVI